MASDRVWCIRRARDTQGPRQWHYQAAEYARTTRRDGLRTWTFVAALGPMRAQTPDGARLATADGEANAKGLSFAAGRVRHGAVAIELSDVLNPAEEAVYRLGGKKYKLLYTWATEAKARIIVGLASREAGPWRFERRVATVTEKQWQDVRAALGLAVDLVRTMPRKAGALVSEKL